MVMVDLICGFLLLFAGRNLFWLCVGVVGFLVGVQCASAFTAAGSSMAWLVAILFGIVGSVLAICFEWLAMVVGLGFLGGGYLTMGLLPLASQGPWSWLIFLTGGLVGVILMIVAFDLALILISSLLGAVLIVNAFHGTEAFRDTLLIASLLTGMLVQYAAKGPESKR